MEAVPARFFLVCLAVSQVLGHNRDVTCATPLVTSGHRRLGYATDSTGSGSIRFLRNGVSLDCGSKLVSQESLGVAVSSINSASEILVEVIGASSLTGSTARCARTRSLDTNIVVTAPASGTVTLQMAYGHEDEGTVYLSPMCTYKIESTACQPCPDGQYRSGCVDGAPGVCVSCPEGSFSATVNGKTTCSPCTAACPSGTYEASTCTTQADRVCLPCSTGDCPSGTYQLSACSATADRVCSQCAPSCESGEYETQACQGELNRNCASCRRKTCPAGQYLLGCGSGLPGSCVDCRGTCGQGTFESKACATTADRVCTGCASTCGAVGYRVTQACTALNNTACTSCSKCASNYFQVAACTASDDTACQKCTTCGSGQYEAKACGKLEDRVCLNCTVCPAGTYRSVACKAGQPGACASCSGPCGADEYQVSACTSSADRVCAAKSLCGPGAYSATGSAPCKACASGKYQPANNATSCATCAAGSQAARNQTACECLPGYSAASASGSEAAGAPVCEPARAILVNATSLDLLRTGQDSAVLGIELGAQRPVGWLQVTAEVEARASNLIRLSSASFNWSDATGYAAAGLRVSAPDWAALATFLNASNATGWAIPAGAYLRMALRVATSDPAYAALPAQFDVSLRPRDDTCLGMSLLSGVSADASACGNTSERMPQGRTCTFRCGSGLTPTAAVVATCLGSNTWSRAQPTCKAVVCTKPTFSTGSYNCTAPAQAPTEQLVIDAVKSGKLAPGSVCRPWCTARAMLFDGADSVCGTDGVMSRTTANCSCEGLMFPGSAVNLGKGCDNEVASAASFQIVLAGAANQTLGTDPLPPTNGSIPPFQVAGLFLSGGRDAVDGICSMTGGACQLAMDIHVLNTSTAVNGVGLSLPTASRTRARTVPRSPLVRIGPAGVAIRSGSARLEIRYSSGQVEFVTNLTLRQYKQELQAWSIIPSTLDKSANALRADITSTGLYAVIETLSIIPTVASTEAPTTNATVAQTTASQVAPTQTSATTQQNTTDTDRVAEQLGLKELFRGGWSGTSTLAAELQTSIALLGFALVLSLLAPAVAIYSRRSGGKTAGTVPTKMDEVLFGK